MSVTHQCPALLITAAASNQGKTSLCAALARLHSRQGKRVKVFKTGPDYLDPMIHQAACGQHVYNLDLWMVGESRCQELLHQAAADCDLILIEAAMGLFDGPPSPADLARQFNLPMLLTIDAGAMAQTFGALVLGLTQYQEGLNFAGIIANRVGSENHSKLLQQGLPESSPPYFEVRRSPALQLPRRHLGLTQASEIDDLQQRLDAAADVMAESGLDQLLPVIDFPAATTATETSPFETKTLAGRRIAIARDAAFSFIYPDNIDCLRQLGAELLFFSPLANESVPTRADALWLPGGYPELHGTKLASAQASIDSVHRMAQAGKPILAECGGMVWLAEQITNLEAQTHAGAACLPGQVTLHKRFQGLGLQHIDWPEGRLRGHTFHYSSLVTELPVAGQAERARDGARGEYWYQHGSIRATYLHHYFAANPAAMGAFFSG